VGKQKRTRKNKGVAGNGDAGLAKQVQAYREAQGLTLDELAGRLSLSKYAVWRAEKGLPLRVGTRKRVRDVVAAGGVRAA